MDGSGRRLLLALRASSRWLGGLQLRCLQLNPWPTKRRWSSASRGGKLMRRTALCALWVRTPHLRTPGAGHHGRPARRGNRLDGPQCRDGSVVVHAGRTAGAARGVRGALPAFSHLGVLGSVNLCVYAPSNKLYSWSPRTRTVNAQRGQRSASGLSAYFKMLSRPVLLAQVARAQQSA